MVEKDYRKIMNDYLKNRDERALYACQKLSRILIEHDIAPEECIQLHRQVMIENDASKEELLSSFDILLEVMVGYGLAYREHQSLRNKQIALRNEIAVAANMQQTLLSTSIPKIDGVDIGAISVPAQQMNGDYYHFLKDENGRIGIAIADVIGKGIPAALSMSMIKYSMDSMPDDRHNPNEILESLNRVVEHNVDPSMFITMCYGVYDPYTYTFRYSTAGHEPGFFYSAKENKYEDFSGRGLLLGIQKRTRYREYQKKIEKNDMVILFSDGVSECRTEERFIEREDLLNYIDKYKHLSAEEIVTNIYKDLERLQDFELRDDFTLIVLKRNK